MTDKNEDPAVAAVVAARRPEGPIDYRILGSDIWSAWNALNNASTDLLCANVWQLPQTIAHFMLMAPEAYDLPKALSSALRTRLRFTCKQTKKTQQSEIPTTFWLSKIGSVVSINLDCGSEADAKDAFDSIMSGYVRRHHHGAVERQLDVVILRIKLASNRNAVTVCDRRNKKRSRGRIDGIVALAMAVGAAEAPQAEGAVSIWDRPE